MTIVPTETLKKFVLRLVNILRDEFGNCNLKLLIEINRLKTFSVTFDVFEIHVFFRKKFKTNMKLYTEDFWSP